MTTARGMGRMVRWAGRAAGRVVDRWMARAIGADLRDRRVVAEHAREVYRYYYAPRPATDESDHAEG